MTFSEIKNLIIDKLLDICITPYLYILYLSSKPDIELRKQFQTDLSIYAGLLAFSTLFLLHLISLPILNITLHLSLLCFSIGIPLLALAISGGYMALISSLKIIKIPRLLSLSGLFGSIFSAVGFILVIFTKSLIAGFLFLLFIIITLYFAKYIILSFATLFKDQYSKEEQEHILNLPENRKKLQFSFNMMSEYSTLNRKNYMGGWELAKFLSNCKPREEALLKSCFILVNEDILSEEDFDYIKTVLRFNNEDEIRQIEKDIKEKLTSLSAKES